MKARADRTKTPQLRARTVSFTVISLLYVLWSRVEKRNKVAVILTSGCSRFCSASGLRANKGRSELHNPHAARAVKQKEATRRPISRRSADPSSSLFAERKRNFHQNPRFTRQACMTLRVRGNRNFQSQGSSAARCLLPQLYSQWDPLKHLLGRSESPYLVTKSKRFIISVKRAFSNCQSLKIEHQIAASLLLSKRDISTREFGSNSTPKKRTL